MFYPPIEFTDADFLACLLIVIMAVFAVVHEWVESKEHPGVE